MALHAGITNGYKTRTMVNHRQQIPITIAWQYRLDNIDVHMLEACIQNVEMRWKRLIVTRYFRVLAG